MKGRNMVLIPFVVQKAQNKGKNAGLHREIQTKRVTENSVSIVRDTIRTATLTVRHCDVRSK
jgi:hypothetical protein